MKRRIIAAMLVMLLLVVMSSTALAAAGNQLYNYGWINHRIDFGPLAKGSAPEWTGGRDENQYIIFQTPGVLQYQNCGIVTSSGVTMSSVQSSNSGGGAYFTIDYYKTTPLALMRVWNPYYGSNLMETKGIFVMTF